MTRNPFRTNPKLLSIPSGSKFPSGYVLLECLLGLCLVLALISCGEETGDSSLATDGDTDQSEELPDGDAVSEDGDSEMDDEPDQEESEPEWELTESMEGIDPSLCAAEHELDPLGFDGSYALLSSDYPILDKNVYLVTVFESVPALAQALGDDGTLSALGAARVQAFTQADCGEDLACWDAALLWSEEDIAQAANALAAWPGASSLIEDHLRPSGAFARFSALSNDELLRKAVSITLADGLNGLWSRFSRELSTADLAALLTDLRSAQTQETPFYQPLAHINQKLLAQIGRDEASRYDPLTEEENRAAFAHIATTNWNAYAFSVMLVPGQGPNDLDTVLHPTGAGRCDLAAERWKAGVVPFILTSGGHVHPDRTPYCEALEMKTYLMETHGIPEEAILIDPYARHTTTNLRNAARTILRYGFPVDKPAMVTSDLFQSAYIVGLDNRLMEELEYLPYRQLEPMTANDSCFLGSAEALTIDPRDPLDP